jgi:membrane associated rhomboid family serine protease
MIAFGYLYANMPMNLLFIPFEIKAKYLVAFLFIMEFVYGIKRTSTGVAHFAHLGGAITGLIIVLLWHNQGKFKRGW